MASAVITNKKKASIKTATAVAFGVLSVIPQGPPTVIVSDTLPFRIRFTNIGIPSYTVNDVPPIGIAIVGLNNYIL